MNPQSDLQQRYPLSHRKFWKKIISNIIGYGILSIFIGGFLEIILAVFVLGKDVGSIESFLSLIIASILIVFLLIILTYSWYIKTYIRRYYYSGEEHFITIKKGVFAPAEIHVQWQKIQDVYVDQDILDRIMGLYDVHIASATSASSIEAHIDGVGKTSADGLKEFFLNKVSGSGLSQSQGTNFSQASGLTQTSQVQVEKINLTEEISSNIYPLSGKWTTVTLFSRLLGSFVFPGFIILFIFAKSKDTSIFDYWVYALLGWLALGFLTMFIRTISLFLWKKNYAFNFTADNIYYREGVLSLSEKNMPYSSIQDVTVSQSFIERIFGLAKVVIENAAQQQMVVDSRGQRSVGFSGIIIRGLTLADANKITNLLKSTVLGQNNSHHGL